MFGLMEDYPMDDWQMDAYGEEIEKEIASEEDEVRYMMLENAAFGDSAEWVDAHEEDPHPWD